MDVEELVLQLLSSPGCQQDHCLNLALSICPHHLHHQLVGLQLVTTCALQAMEWVLFSMLLSLCPCSVSVIRYFKIQITVKVNVHHHHHHLHDPQDQCSDPPTVEVVAESVQGGGEKVAEYLIENI